MKFKRLTSAAGADFEPAFDLYGVSFPIHVSTRNGNVVVLSEDDYRGILETLEMNANPVMKQKLLEGKDTPLSECIPESEVEW